MVSFIIDGFNRIIRGKIYQMEESLMSRHMRNLLLFVITCILAGSISNGICDTGMEEYKPALLDIRLSLPRSWYYADREVQDDNLFCKGLEMTADEFKKQYLYGDTYVVAYDIWSGTFMALDVDETKVDDYLEMSDSQILETGDSRFDWLDSSRLYTIISKSVIRPSETYYKYVNKSAIKTYYYYLTAHGGKKYFFEFSIENKYISSLNEQELDEIIGSLSFVDK